MKRPPLALMGVAIVLAITFSLRGQVTVPGIPAGTVSLSAANIRTLGTLSDAQFGEWLDVLAATPTMAPEDLPRGGMVGNYYSLAHPNWPPLPADIWQIPIWNLSSDSGSGFYLLDDLDYPESSATGGMMAMDAPNPPGFVGSSGTNGGGGYSSNLQPQVFTTNDLWLQLVGTTNTGTALTAQLVIHTPWNVTNGVYGLYFKTNLAIPYNWTWLLRNVPGQTNLIVTNLPLAQGFFKLGDPTAIRPVFDTNSLGHEDDNPSALATLPFTINLLGTSYSNLYVNNNGNVTFNNYLIEYTPEPLVDEAEDYELDIIAPFWADVDTRSTYSGVTTYGTNTVDGRAAFGVSWINVGYYTHYATGVDKLNSFQLVLIDRSDRTNGDYDIEFNYSQIQWEAGDVSGGCDGLWTGRYPGSSNCEPNNFGFSARVGYASTSGSTFELNGSAVPGALLDTNLTTGLIYHDFNSTVPGRYVFQFHNGVPLGTP
jgi:hypothetical protein